jgi:hypothetical protein
LHAIQLIHEGFEHVHEAVRQDIAQLEPDWLFWQPEPGLNHIGFLLWHLVRDEDQVLSYLANEEETWRSGHWYERFGMDPKEQGTGMDATRLESFRYELPEFMQYADSVWSRLGPRLGTLSEDDLDRPGWPGSDWNVGQQLVEGLLGHAWLHLGEIRSIMGLRGWRFRE